MMAEYRREDPDEELIEAQEEFEEETDELAEDEEETEEEAGEETDEEDEEDEEGAEPEEDPLIPVRIANDDGTVSTRNIRYSELGTYIGLAERYSDPGFIREIERATKISQRSRNSSVMQYYDYWADRGLTDEEIMAKMYAELRAKNFDPERAAAREETPEERMQRLLEQKLGPIEQRLALEEQNRFRQANLEHNATLLSNAVAELGIDPVSLTNKQKAAMRASFEKYYEGMDLSSQRLKQNQANGIVKDALGGPRRRPVSDNVRRAQSAPRIGGARTSQQRQSSGQAPASGLQAAAENWARFNNSL